MEQSIAQLEARIERLSARTRQQQMWLITLSVVLIAIGCIAARPTDRDIVRARQFEAVDANGRVVALLTSEWGYGAPALVLLDGKEEELDAFAFLTKMPFGRPNDAMKSSVVMLHLEGDDEQEEDFGVASLAAGPAATALNLSRNDAESIGIGMAKDCVGISIARDTSPDPDDELNSGDPKSQLFEFTAQGDRTVFEIHDTAGKSLLRVP